jgi:hypothetical protein
MAMGDRDGPREHRRPYLPSGYTLDELAERDFAVLRRPDGSEEQPSGRWGRTRWRSRRGPGRTLGGGASAPMPIGE